MRAACYQCLNIAVWGEDAVFIVVIVVHECYLLVIQLMLLFFLAKHDDWKVAKLNVSELFLIRQSLFLIKINPEHYFLMLNFITGTQTCL